MFYYSSLTRNIKGIFAGLILMSVSTISILATIIFINANSASDTELLMNSVAILFLNDIDEQVYAIVSRLKPSWIEFLEDEIANKENNLSREIPETRIDFNMEHDSSIKLKCLNVGSLNNDNICEDFSSLLAYAKDLNGKVMMLNDEKSILQHKVQNLEDENSRILKDLQMLKSFLGIEDHGSAP